MARLARAAAIVELTALVAGVVIGGRYGVLATLVLVSIALAMRGERWFVAEDRDRGAAWSAAAGVVIGGLALAGALAMSSRLMDATGFAVEWSTAPTVRGSAARFAIAALPTLAMAVAAEMVFRRWLLERVAALVRESEPPVIGTAAGVLAAAVAEAAILPVGEAGGLGRLGLVMAAGGLGLLYAGSAGRLPASLGARVAFELGALAIQALRLVG